MFGLLAGTALLFVPGAGPLIVLGPLAATAVGAAEVHGGEDEVARAQQILSESGSTDVQRHDACRGPTDRIGPIEQLWEGMRVVDADDKEIGKVKLVKLGDPDAITTQGQDLGGHEPDVGPPFAARLLRLGFIGVGRRGLFRGDVCADACRPENSPAPLVDRTTEARLGIDGPDVNPWPT
jgi:hypothetical protein